MVDDLVMLLFFCQLSRDVIGCEERALATYKRTLPLWLRYVDDTFKALHKDTIDDFHKHLNRQNAYIQFA